VDLVQLFQDAPCPDLLARHLLRAALEDFRETALHHRLYLVVKHQTALCIGAHEQAKALDREIRQHADHEEIPRRWRLDFLFSERCWRSYGDGLLPCWATVLILICTLQQHWKRRIGLPPRQPYLLPGFHSGEAVRLVWREDFRRTWDTELRDVYPELGVR
jgi:hypothetical protein